MDEYYLETATEKVAVIKYLIGYGIEWLKICANVLDEIQGNSFVSGFGKVDIGHHSF